MNIDDLTVKELRELKCLVGNQERSQKEHPFKIGENYLIRTVTMIQLGRLEAVYDNEIVLSSASWIADTGRFFDALRDGVKVFKEIEPFINDVIVGRGSIVDATIWSKPLAKEQK